MTDAVYAFCARSVGNMPTVAPKDNGLCESRRVDSEAGYIPHDGEVVCRGCGMLTAMTWGIVGSGTVGRDGNVKPLAVVLSCPADRGAGTMTYHLADRDDTIEVGPNEPAACVTARLHAAIGREIQEATNGKDRTMTKTMTTSEILEMALRVAEIGRMDGDVDARIIVTPTYSYPDGAEAATRGVRINVEPVVKTDVDDSRVGVIMGCRGATLDAAALAMLPTVYRAEEVIRTRVAKKVERDAKQLASLDAATGRGAR